MKKRAIYILLIIFSNSLLFAQTNPQQIFKEANQYYAQKEYVKAIEKYEHLIKQGNVSANIYYNLANAYYRNNNIGKAILNYKRAKKLDPSDYDINFNLQLAQLKIIDKIQPLPKFFLSKWIEDISKSQSPETFGIIAIIFSFIGFGLLTIYIFARKSGAKKASFFSGIASLVIMIAFVLLAFQSNSYRTSDKEGVIISPTAYIKSSPDQTAMDLFILHEGTEIEVLDKVANWSKIRIANGNQGWIEDNKFEKI
ncbi:MAG TPA: tetratricopeptide repeat protein [Candidatus Kapabacteria bacterium]|nr:tetratricopeptide repeat protein [Candidatus Kapabacteria bacterium]